MAKIPIILEPGRADGKLIKTNSVYDDNQEKFLSDKITEIDDNHNTLNNTVNSLTDIVNNNKTDIENKLETEKNRATNAENNLREIINNITDTNGNTTTAELITVNTLPNSTVSNVQQALDDLYKNIIYDVSQLNGGIVFESLQALLSSSNVDTLIPMSVRRGGITIRFIQGSVSNPNNKYVQYILTNQNWSVDITDWQEIGSAEFSTGEKVNETGIDNEPNIESNNLVKSGGVASIMMKHGLINKLDKSKIIFDINDLHPIVGGGKIPTTHKDNNTSFTRIYISTFTNTTSILLGGTNVVPISSGICTFAVRVKASSYESLNFRVFLYKEDGSSYIRGNDFSVTNSEFTDYYFSVETNTFFKIVLEAKSYQDIDISKIYIYDGNKEDCLLDFIIDEDKEQKITTNLLTEFIHYRTNKWSNRSVDRATDFIEIPESGILTCYGFPVVQNQTLNVYLYNSNKEYVTYTRINLGMAINILKIDTSLYKYIVIYNNGIDDDRTKGFICEGWYPWIENDELSEKLQNFKVAPSKLYPVGKNKVSLIFKDTGFDNTGSIMSYYYKNGSVSTSMIDVKGIKDICISGIPSSDFSSVKVMLLVNNNSTLLKQFNLSVSGNEFNGVITNTGAETLVVSMIYTEKNYNLSNFQIEFDSKKTSYEPTIFGIKDIYGIPFVKDNQSAKIEYPEIGTTFIFGDSITATNTNSVLSGNPEEYTNSVASISYVPALMSKLNITSWYNFALGGAIWRDIESTRQELGDFALMSTQVQKAIDFSNSSGKMPNLILIAMGANDGFSVPSGSEANAETEFNRVMYGEYASTFGYSGIPIEQLDRTMLAEAIRYNMHRLEEVFPNAVKMVILPIQASNMDYIVNGKEKREIIRLMANAYGMECIEGYAQTGIIKHFETKKEGSNFVGPFRDLQDQVHPNTNGQMKEVRLYANKIRSRFLY